MNENYYLLADLVEVAKSIDAELHRIADALSAAEGTQPARTPGLPAVVETEPSRMVCFVDDRPDDDYRIGY